MNGRILLLVAWMLVLHGQVFAQKNDHRYKMYEGHYGHLSGICLFADGTFLLHGYATAVFGRYGFEKDYLVFQPDQLDRFEVYAYHNKSIGDSLRFNFSGFDREEIFVQFDRDSVQRVFNKDANCFASPFVYQTAKASVQINLCGAASALYTPDEGNALLYSFAIQEGSNDFILLNNKPSRYREPFSAGTVQTDGEDLVLAFSANLGRNGLEREKPADYAEWKDLLAWKDQYFKAKNEEASLYVNPYYNTFEAPDNLNYKYDASSNQYLSLHHLDPADYDQDNPYSDNRYLRKYIKLQALEKRKTSLPNQGIAHNSVFYTLCEDPAGSYYYKGISPKKLQDEPEPPVAIPPLETLPIGMDPQAGSRCE